jgi:large subunit ribosomal protein L22
VSKGIGVSAKRVRLIINEMRGRRVQEALDLLRFMPGPVPEHIAKTLRSAVANAENNMALNPTSLRIVTAYADVGPVLKRFRPRARGRVGKVSRPTSHITIVVGEQGEA